MPYVFLEDGVTSDVTFRATGRDLDELFTSAADAVTTLMVERIDSVSPAITKRIQLTAGALDLLLLALLDEIIFHKDAGTLLLRATHVQVTPGEAECTVTADLCGERIDPAKHELLADPKGVTLYGLRVEPIDHGWQAQVTIDV